MEVTDFDTEKKRVNVTIINDIKKKISFYIFIVFIILKKKQWHVRKLNFPKKKELEKNKHWKRFYDKTKRII